MTRAWATIAKAEFRVMTSRFRNHRYLATTMLVLVGSIWTFGIAPSMMKGILNLFAPEFQQILAAAYPGVMRSVLLLLWMMILVYPISYSLREIRIGQWEIMLSNNVRTRDMMLGLFLGKIPAYGLLVLFLAPLLISPFIIFYQVSMIGQLFTLLVIVLYVLTTLLLSTIVSTAIQARLGDSARGNDIAKAMGLVVVVLFLLPVYGLLYFAEAFAQLMGLDVFLLLPSTWGADLITWITIFFNGINVPYETIVGFEGALGLRYEIDLLLSCAYLLLVLLAALVTPDRIFSLEGGVRSDKVITVGDDNVLLRVLKRIVPGSLGILITVSLKDFGRKAQNVSKMLYAMFLAILLPLMLNFSAIGDMSNPEQALVITSFMISLVLGMIAGVTFGGVGFLESRDHLWIIKSTPRGVERFMVARLIQSILFGIPIACLPVIIITLILVLPVTHVGVMLLQAYLVLFGTLLVGIGVTALNPAYENTKSAAFYVNAFSSIFITMIALLTGFVLELATGVLEIGLMGGILVSVVPIISIGITIIVFGILKLTKTEG